MSYENIIEETLSEINLVQVNEEAPSKDKIIQNAQWLNDRMYRDGQLYDWIQELAVPFFESSSNTYKVYVYAIGARLFDLGEIKEAKIFFEWCIQIDTNYFQAYKFLGDCLMKLRSRFDTASGYWEEAIQYFRTSIYYCEKTYNDSRGVPKENYLGDNYLKIGICYKEIGELQLGKSFVIKASEIVTDTYTHYQDLGFDNWSQILQIFNEED